MSVRDVAGLNLQLQRGMNVSGRLQFETTTGTPFDPASWSVGLTLMLAVMEVAIWPGATRVDVGGAFAIDGITPARYRLFAGSPPTVDGRRWFVRSAVVNGREIGDVPFRLEAGENLTGVVVTLTDRWAALGGTLVNPAGQAAPDYFVIAFPVDRRRWYSGSRAIKALRPGTDGKFSFAAMPAGDYYLAALTDVEQNEWFDPAFLDRLIAAAVKVTLVEGETRIQDLKIVSVPVFPTIAHERR